MAQGTIVVTGASGFVGSALVRRLQELGRPVLAVSRRAGAPLTGVRASTLASYEDAAALDAACDGAAGVVHLAALAHRSGSPQEFAGSVRAGQALAHAAVRARVPRFVLVSSVGVLGNHTDSGPFTEASPARPVEPYALSKLRTEDAVAAATAGTATGLVIVRPPLVYGPQAPGNFGRLVELVRRGLPLPVARVRNARTFIGIDNLLDLLVLCLDHPAASGELFLAGDAEDLSTPQLARCIGEGLGRPAWLPGIAPPLLLAAATLLGRRRLAESLCASLQVDASKARRVLGWTPAIPAEEGVRRAARAWTA
ncbi:NAD-dependent epimerase/dehydratase family protein [Ramlibacter sp.]|uniref:NAD-dependent epimerase/dehydratase family protein n=1 Tax=Ramlibacter sp. TaxID=1917967 RepID=UPI002D2ED58E|nr:NAD-dependent epimerase/dehydratase family protein [Ramlibacter sp.]HYD74813.1 NAD-dependent epimerase/dehydratase family protein [Ramlibacter sp.]